MQILLQKKGGGFMGWFIRLWTGSPYCHCELELRDGMRITASAGHGVCLNPPLTVASMSYWDEIPLLNVTVEQEEIIRQFFSEEVGSGYDWSGIIFSHLLPFGWESRSRWFCSEFCAAALEKAGVIQFKGRRLAAWYSPARLLKALQRIPLSSSAPTESSES